MLHYLYVLPNLNIVSQPATKRGNGEGTTGSKSKNGNVQSFKNKLAKTAQITKKENAPDTISKSIQKGLWKKFLMFKAFLKVRVIPKMTTFIRLKTSTKLYIAIPFLTFAVSYIHHYLIYRSFQVPEKSDRLLAISYEIF